MSRTVKTAALAGLMAFVSAAAWGAEVTPLTQTTAAPPQWLNTNDSGLYLGPNGFSQVTQSATTAKLGDGLSAGLFSSLSNTPTGAPMNSYGGGSLADSVSRSQTGLYSAPGSTPGYGLNGFAGAPATSTFGGQVTKDLGGGVSVNFVGGVTRDATSGFYPGSRGSLNMTSGGDVSASVGAGMSMDLGGGSSFSLSGTVSKGSSGFGAGRCAGLSLGFCR